MESLYYKTNIDNTNLCVIANNGNITMSINEKFEKTSDINNINLDNVCHYLSSIYWKYSETSISGVFMKLADEIVDKFNLK